MQLFEEQHDPTHIAAVADAAGSYGAPIRDDAEEDELPGLGENFVVDVLAAVAGMALRSKRRQADLDAALRCAGVECESARRLAVLERLRTRGYVDKVVELSDGGVLLSVTALGLDRLGGARRR